MPKYEVYNDEFNNRADLTLMPSEGDVRIKNMGTVEKMDAQNQWVYVCDINQMDVDVMNHTTKIINLEAWMNLEKAKATPEYRSDLEKQFDDLHEAGEALDQIETMAQNARIQLRLIEVSVEQARMAYRQLTKYTTEKQKTFDRLDTPYPDQDGEGYSI